MLVMIVLLVALAKANALKAQLVKERINISLTPTFVMIAVPVLIFVQLKRLHPVRGNRNAGVQEGAQDGRGNRYENTYGVPLFVFVDVCPDTKSNNCLSF